jgi:hypothetical protein
MGQAGEARKNEECKAKRKQNENTGNTPTNESFHNAACVHSLPPLIMMSRCLFYSDLRQRSFGVIV